MIPKVLAYITRESPHGKELLVFRHQHHPEAGVQVPGGTVEDGEDLIAGLWREVEEETGLVHLKLIGQIAKAPFYADWRAEWQERNVFHLEAPSNSSDTWVHVVKAGVEDKGLSFEFFWVTPAEAESNLRWGQGRWLNMI